MIAHILVSVLLVVMGILVLIGKGDKLIAGYNTASREEQAKYHIRRLRALIGGLMIVLAVMISLLLGKETMEGLGAFMAITLILCFAVIILANTWAKKRRGNENNDKNPVSPGGRVVAGGSGLRGAACR